MSRHIGFMGQCEKLLRYYLHQLIVQFSLKV